MKLQKPILHGRDHNCGGADPIPGICDLIGVRAWIDNIIAMLGGGQYVSVQDGTFTYDTGGTPADIEITNWPRITIPRADWIANRAVGNGLYAQWKAYVQGGLTRIDMEPFNTNIPDDLGDDDPVAGGWTTLAASGMLLAAGYSGDPGEDRQTWMRFQGGAPSIRGGIVSLYWTAAPPESTVLYPGNWPLLDSDIAENADVDPLKVAHPGGTTKFLRGDSTWSDLVLEVEF